MKKIYFVGRYRGFLLDLFSYNFKSIEFKYINASKFEIIKKHRALALKLFNHKAFNFLGLFTTVKVKNDSKYHLSYNRFLEVKENQKYVIILENPTALVNYSDTKMYSNRAKKKLKKYFESPNLIAIACMSQACLESFPIFYPEFKNSNKLVQIYPLIPDMDKNSLPLIKKQSSHEFLDALYVSSNFELKGGNDILEVFKKLEKHGTKINLTVITKTENLTVDQKDILDQLKNVEVIDFKLDRENLNRYYKKSQILLNPTRMDSFSLVTLEAIKHGCAVIGSDIYAIKEMVVNNKNGYLIKPRYEYWKSDGSINHDIKINPKQTYDSGYIDEKMINFMYEKLIYLEKNRDILQEFQLYSYEKSINSKFGARAIASKWEKLYSD